MRRTSWSYLGRVPYAATAALQVELREALRRGEGPERLLLLEHEPVFSLGRNATVADILWSSAELAFHGVEVAPSDRGGQVTFHGPGQLVGYPILDLHDYYLDLHRYLRDLEEVIIRVLSLYDIRGERMPEYTGVWVKGEKICALGIRSSGWVTMHGFALNVTTDLSYFGRIIPCGIFERGVTSMEAVTGRTVPLAEVAARTAEVFGEVFGRPVEPVSGEALGGNRVLSKL